MPPAGNQPVRAASMSSSRPESTSGVDSQTNAPSERTRSIHVCWRAAASAPSGTARPHVTSIAADASNSVLSSPVPRTANTGRW